MVLDPVTASDVDVAPCRVVPPSTVKNALAKMLPPTFSIEEMVEEPFTANAEVVAFENVIPPLAFKIPPTLSVELIVVEPLMAREVPVATRPVNVALVPVSVAIVAVLKVAPPKALS